MGASGSLQIRDVRVGDEGVYQCRAENSEDSLDSAATVSVQVGPKFVREPENVKAFVTADVELRCDVFSVPAATVQWYKNGELLVESDYFQVRDTADEGSVDLLLRSLQIVRGTNLKILGVVEKDTGVYQCIASNPVGNVQASAQLQVLPKGQLSHLSLVTPGQVFYFILFFCFPLLSAIFSFIFRSELPRLFLPDPVLLQLQV